MKKKVWTKQPQVPVEIDFSHPIGKHIVDAFFANVTITNLKSAWSLNSRGAGLVTTPIGRCFQSGGSGTNPVPVTLTMSPSVDWDDSGDTYLHLIEYISGGNTTYANVGSGYGSGLAISGSQVTMFVAGVGAFGSTVYSATPIANRINIYGAQQVDGGTSVDADIWFNGNRIATTTSGPQVEGYTFSNTYGGFTGYSTLICRFWGVIRLRGRITDAGLMRSLYENPWQIFKAPQSRSFRKEVVIEGAVRYSRPISDVAAGSWLPSTGSDLYAMVDEVSADDADYIYTTTVNSVCSLALQSVIDPNTSANQVLKYRARSSSNSNLIVRLKQGTTTIATRTHTNVPATATIYSMVLTSGECDAITDYTNLKVEMEAT